MAIEITIPRLGWSMEEGTFSSWFKQPGDRVEAGEPLFAVESDKVTMDVESLDSGVLFVPEGSPQAGETVKPGQCIGYLLTGAEQPPAAAAPPRETPSTPRARRAARQAGIDIRALKGTGRGGRIRERDVPAVRAPARQPVTALRRAIADRMMLSRQNTAPVTLTTRADATSLVQLRKKWAAEPVPSIADIFVKAVAAALLDHPMLGSRWEDDRIVLPEAIHIGLAVDTEHGLFAPVIRDVEKLSLAAIAVRSRELVAAARARRLDSGDLQGGVFTITNLGMYGIDAFTPILNYPETAVLGLGAIRREAVVLADGWIAPREQMTLSLTFDHRVVDGAPAARFLQRVAASIESVTATET